MSLPLEAAIITTPPGDASPLVAGRRQIVVDAGPSIGRLKSFQGVNGAPAPSMHKPEYFKFGGWNMPEKIDATIGYRLARIDLVRTHDAYGPGDIDAKFETADAPGGGLISAKRDVLDIFPNPDADPNQPRNYQFGPTDQLIGSIVRIGAQVIFRLGRSEGADPTPPKDFARYADVARHIVMHYERGWANGFHYRLRYWEIWNEPDLGKVFWSGTSQQYFQLYGRLARAVKSVDPSALVGGPAIARPNDDTPYRDAFLEYVRSEKLPLDFYSWHWYATDSDDPLDFYRISRDIRTRLDTHGFRRAVSLLDEWNYGLVDPPPPAVQRAAFIASALIYLQDAPVDAATLYRGDSLFGADGATPDKTGFALIAMGRMKDTPLRLKAQGGDLNGYAVEAGRSSDGRVIQVLISNYQIPAQLIGPRTADDVLHVPPQYDVRLLARRSVHYAPSTGYDLTINHLPQNRRFAVRVCRISADADFTSVAPGNASAATFSSAAIFSGATVRLRQDLAAPGIELVTLRALESAPTSGRRRPPETTPAEADRQACLELAKFRAS